MLWTYDDWQVTPGLKDALVDPLPEVRGVTAKAFGAMVKGMGEEHFAELLPWLLETLCSDAGTVDRSGAAQVQRGSSFISTPNLSMSLRAGSC
jgi:hypothetical protein